MMRRVMEGELRMRQAVFGKGGGESIPRPVGFLLVVGHSLPEFVRHSPPKKVAIRSVIR